MKNQNTTQIAYIVTADYYTNGKPTTCKITVQPVNFDPAPSSRHLRREHHETERRCFHGSMLDILRWAGSMPMLQRG